MDSLLNDVSVSTRIEDLGLSVRTRRALRRCGCATTADVLRLDLNARIRGLGEKSKRELSASMNAAGFRLSYDDASTQLALLDGNVRRLRRQLDAIAAAADELASIEEHLARLKARNARCAT